MQDAIKQLSYFYRVLKLASSRQKIYLRFISLIKIVEDRQKLLHFMTVIFGHSFELQVQ